MAKRRREHNRDKRIDRHDVELQWLRRAVVFLAEAVIALLIAVAVK